MMHKLLCIWAGPYFADMIAVIIGESGFKMAHMLIFGGMGPRVPDMTLITGL